MKGVATIVLNRNLPEVTDRLCEHLLRYDGDCTDVFVVESGSAPEKVSRFATWNADWKDAREHGLRYGRGMNFGLGQLWKSGRHHHYQAFFLLTNDTVLEPRPSVGPLMEILRRHPRVGILSPCSNRWGEKRLLADPTTRYFWFIHNNAYLLRRELIEALRNDASPAYMNFLFDGDNFRGYGMESELIAKGYANNWAAAITAEVCSEENEEYLLHHSDLIRTEPYEENLRLYVEEGKAWMRRKYGFPSRWAMQQHVKNFYDRFFEFHPEEACYKI